MAVVKKGTEVRLIQKQTLIVIFSKIEIPYLNVLFLGEWLVNVLAVPLPQFLVHLMMKLWPIIEYDQKSFLSYRLSCYYWRCLVNELKSFVVWDLVTTYYGIHTQLLNKYAPIINLISDLKSAWFYKQQFIALIELIDEGLVTRIAAEFKRAK